MLVPELFLPHPLDGVARVGLEEVVDHVHVVDRVQDQRLQLQVQHLSNVQSHLVIES